jgi:acetyl esterase/lipase
VNVFGPADAVLCDEKSAVAWIFRLFMGGTPAEVPEQYKSASPITYVSADDPPVLTLHGDQDTLVPIEQARTLDEKIKAVGASHTLVVFAGQGHGVAGEHQEKAVKAMWDLRDTAARRLSRRCIQLHRTNRFRHSASPDSERVHARSGLLASRWRHSHSVPLNDLRISAANRLLAKSTVR